MRATVDAIADELDGIHPRGTWLPAGHCRESATGAALLDAPAEELIALALGALRKAARLWKFRDDGRDYRDLSLHFVSLRDVTYWIG
jgi:hypothetical protein